MIHDQIVFRILDKKVRERLLRETELTLAEAMKICQASELAQQHAKTFSEHAKDLDKVAMPVAAVTGPTQKQRRSESKQQKDTEPFACKRCGNQHAPKQCPAYGKICSKCKRKITLLSNAFPKGNRAEMHVFMQWKKLKSQIPSL